MDDRREEDQVNMLKYEKQKVLILAPHADDETLGCGGIIQRFLAEGSQVRIVIASFVLGEYTKFKKEMDKYEVYAGSDRLKELKFAMQILGVTDYHFMFTDSSDPVIYHSRLDTIPKIDLVAKIESHIQEFQPTLLFIPSKTKHQDHLILHEVGVTASRPYFWNGSVMVYETDGELAFEPNFYLPLSDQELKRKLDALLAYQTQIGKDQHPVSAHACKIKAEFRGQIIYSRYAEAFQILRLRG